MICVCNLSEMPRHVAALRPSHLVSLVPPAEQPPTPPGIPGARHLRLEIDDINQPLPGHILPQADHIAALIEFVKDWRGEAPLLLHCVAGVSRSMAAALIALNLASPRREAETGAHVRRAAPHAVPNRRMIELADRLLGCQGRLVAAREAMGPAVPLAAAPLVRLPLLQRPAKKRGQRLAR
ncbi:MAG: tyrosine phosphatase family protein [Kiloniellaceae bacterium]